MRINKARNIKSGIKIWVESSHTLTPAGTIGGTALSVAQLPAHTHGRGTTDIKGTVGGLDLWKIAGSGAFYQAKYGNNKNGGGTGTSDYEYHSLFQASKNWSGTSQSIGSGSTHTHSWTGTQVTINHMNPYSVAYCYRRIS